MVEFAYLVWLNGLAMISFEKDLIKNLDFSCRCIDGFCVRKSVKNGLN